jgi:hypothetical protein
MVYGLAGRTTVIKTEVKAIKPEGFQQPLTNAANKSPQSLSALR